MTPWPTAHQASLSFVISWSLQVYLREINRRKKINIVSRDGLIGIGPKTEVVCLYPFLDQESYLRVFVKMKGFWLA